MLTRTRWLLVVLSAAIACTQDTEARLLRAQEQLNRQLAQTNFALESSRRLFQILIEGVDDYFIFVIDTGGTCRKLEHRSPADRRLHRR